jgi:hypothetical protein
MSPLGARGEVKNGPLAPTAEICPLGGMGSKLAPRGEVGPQPTNLLQLESSGFETHYGQLV